MDTILAAMLESEIDLEGDFDDSKSASDSPIAYKREFTKPLKHNNDFVNTNKTSARSEGVKDMSLDDVITNRKIAAPVKKENRGSSRNVMFSDDGELGLDDIIEKRRFTGKGRQNVDKSLDEIIKGNGPQNGSKRRRSEEDEEEFGGANSGEEDELAMAPLDVIDQVTKDGLVIEHDIGKQTETTEGRSHNWRATFKCGSVIAVAEAPLKLLARQAAAKEFIEEMADVEPERNFPRCKIPEGCFYDPVVITKLNDVAKGMGLDEPRFETILSKKFRKDYFTTKYYIGEDEFVGNAYREDHSKILAAKAAYETYAQRPFHKEKYFTRDNCIKEKDYVCRETATTHVMRVHAPIPPVVGIMDMMDDESESGGFEIASKGSFGLRNSEEEELFVDDRGNMYARCEGSNKIRRLNPVNVETIIEKKVMGILAGVAGVSNGNGDAVDDSDLMDDILVNGDNGDVDDLEGAF